MLYLPCFLMWYVNFFLKLLFIFRKACILFHWLLLYLSFWCSSLGISEKNSFRFYSLLSWVSVESHLLSVQQSIITFALAFLPFPPNFSHNLHFVRLYSVNCYFSPLSPPVIRFLYFTWSDTVFTLDPLRS